MGTGKGLERVQTDDPKLNQLQDKLAEALKPLLKDPAAQLADWRFVETVPTRLEPTRFLQLQYRAKPSTEQAKTQPLGVWTTVFAVPYSLATWSTGQYLTRDATGTLAWGTPAGTATGGGGWTTILDLDFSAQATQAMATDGNYTIAGLTFSRQNAASDATAMALTNGSGLVIQPIAATDYFNATRTLPLVRLTLSQLGIPNLAWSTGIRIWAYVSTAVYSANYDNSLIALDGDNTNFVCASLRGYGAAAPGLTTRKIVAGATVGGQINQPPAANNNVQCLVIPHIGGPEFFNIFGEYSGGWPADSAMPYAGGITDTTGFTIQPSGTLVGPDVPGVYGIVLGAIRAGSGTALSVTFARLRVDYRS